MEAPKRPFEPITPANSPPETSADTLHEDVVAWLEEPPPTGIWHAAEAEEDSLLLSRHVAAVTPAVRRRWKLPLVLFGLTCISTFLAGMSRWHPSVLMLTAFVEGMMPIRRACLANWSDGLLYTGAVLSILLAHEMGHFIATLVHRIPASYPFFLPFPISPLGTLGAVIGMDGSRANRREIFDIGLAGPIAGLVVAVPLFVIGLRQVDLTQYQYGAYQLDLPLAARWLMQALGTPGYEPGIMVWQAQLNPLFMAGWVGFFVTGLNMLPVSQLDGGHVIYTLFGRTAHWVARIFMVTAIVYMLISWNLGLSVMIGLILFIGVDHPPTRDDAVPLGWFRVTLGLLSLAIPLLCFPLRVIV